MEFDKYAIFRNCALTHRLEVLASEAIRVNEPLFERQTGCSIREYRILRMINRHGGIAFNDIMHITGLDRSLVSRLIRELLKRDLIYRVNSESDARRFGLFTTEAGKATCETADSLSREAEKRLFVPLEPGELEQLNELLDKLVFWVRSDAYQEALAQMADLPDPKS